MDNDRYIDIHRCRYRLSDAWYVPTCHISHVTIYRYIDIVTLVQGIDVDIGFERLDEVIVIRIFVDEADRHTNFRR
jgi:hypothetical protein